MSVNAKLRLLASKLPDYPKFKNGKMQTTLFKSLDPEKKKLISKEVPILYNHFEELKKAYKECNIEGVKDYIRKVYDHNKMELPAGLAEA